MKAAIFTLMLNLFFLIASAQENRRINKGTLTPNQTTNNSSLSKRISKNNSPKSKSISSEPIKINSRISKRKKED